jgi:membrane protein YdbS with pleckstrin-like domain
MFFFAATTRTLVKWKLTSPTRSQDSLIITIIVDVAAFFGIGSRRVSIVAAAAALLLVFQVFELL